MFSRLGANFQDDFLQDFSDKSCFVGIDLFTVVVCFIVKIIKTFFFQTNDCCPVTSYQLCDIDCEEFLMAEYKNGDCVRDEN